MHLLWWFASNFRRQHPWTIKKRTRGSSRRRWTFTSLLQMNEKKQPIVNYYNVTWGGVLQQRGWVGKQLSSRRTPVLTFSVDLDTENTWQCHSLHFKSTGCFFFFPKSICFPFFIPRTTKSTFHLLWESWRSKRAARKGRQDDSYVKNINPYMERHSVYRRHTSTGYRRTPNNCLCWLTFYKGPQANNTSL